MSIRNELAGKEEHMQLGAVGTKLLCYSLTVVRSTARSNWEVAKLETGSLTLYLLHL